MKSRAPKFKATHIITHDDRMIEVMVCEPGAGPGYTREEFENADNADYSRDADNRWFFQGQAFNGSVITKRSKMRTGRQGIQIKIELTHPANKIEVVDFSSRPRAKGDVREGDRFWLREMNFWNAQLLSDAVFILKRTQKKARVEIVINGQKRELIRVVSDPGAKKADALFK